jgi:hypothetical protein
MFDRIMENSMAIWVLISAAFPVFAIGTLIKALLHYRRLRAANEPYSATPVAFPRFPEAAVSRTVRASAEDDWIPSR